MKSVLPKNVGKTHGAFPAQPDADNAGAGNPSHLAHDARNCLTVLRVYCDLLRSSDAIRDGYEPWMDELAGAVERGQRLMDSLLDSIVAPRTTELQSEKHGFETDMNDDHSVLHWPERPHLAAVSLLDIAGAVRRRLPILQCMAGDKIRVDIHAPIHIGKVRLSEDDFERILYNLAGNAVEAMPQGGALSIVLESGQLTPAVGGVEDTEESAGTVSLYIADTGTGIEPSRLPHIFETGFSGKCDHEQHPEHHGFGLAIVRELTERAGGKVQVYSQCGCGSRFEVKLPAA